MKATKSRWISLDTFSLKLDLMSHTPHASSFVMPNEREVDFMGKWNAAWIQSKIKEMIDFLNGVYIPESNPSGEKIMPTPNKES